VIVQSIEDARAAVAGGADRLEVVRDIDRRGLTPDAALVRAILSETSVPLRIMIRESDGFSVSGATEVSTLQRAMETFAALPIDGIVIGFARGPALDLDLTRAVLAIAPHVLATFHHAFDEAADPFSALDALTSVPQIDRVLTAGGGGAWTSRCSRLAEYVARAEPGLTILAGGGVDDEVLGALAASGVVREAHVGRAAREPQLRAAPVSVAAVRRLRQRCVTSSRRRTDGGLR